MRATLAPARSRRSQPSTAPVPSSTDAIRNFASGDAKTSSSTATESAGGWNARLARRRLGTQVVDICSGSQSVGLRRPPNKHERTCIQRQDRWHERKVAGSRRRG